MADVFKKTPKSLQHIIINNILDVFDQQKEKIHNIIFTNPLLGNTCTEEKMNLWFCRFDIFRKCKLHLYIYNPNLDLYDNSEKIHIKQLRSLFIYKFIRLFNKLIYDLKNLGMSNILYLLGIPDRYYSDI